MDVAGRADRVMEIAEISPGPAADFEDAVARPQRQAFDGVLAQPAWKKEYPFEERNKPG